MLSSLLVCVSLLGQCDTYVEQPTISVKLQGQEWSRFYVRAHIPYEVVIPVINNILPGIEVSRHEGKVYLVCNYNACDARQYGSGDAGKQWINYMASTGCSATVANKEPLLPIPAPYARPIIKSTPKPHVDAPDLPTKLPGPELPEENSATRAFPRYGT